MYLQCTFLIAGLCLVKCFVAGVKIEFLIDSGSTINIIPKSAWEEIEKARIMSRVAHKISNFEQLGTESVKVFGGGEIPVLFSFYSTIEIAEAVKSLAVAKIIVVDGDVRAILSKDTAKALQVLKVGLETYNVHVESCGSQSEFPTIPGKVARLDIDRSIVPVQIPRVRIPIALEDQLLKCSKINGQLTRS